MFQPAGKTQGTILITYHVIFLLPSRKLLCMCPPEIAFFFFFTFQKVIYQLNVSKCASLLFSRSFCHLAKHVSCISSYHPFLLTIMMALQLPPIIQKLKSSLKLFRIIRLWMIQNIFIPLIPFAVLRGLTRLMDDSFVVLCSLIYRRRMISFCCF